MKFDVVMVVKPEYKFYPHSGGRTLYVVALIISFSEWAHLLLNSKRLLRYDATKLAPTGKSPLYENRPKNLSFCFLEMAKNGNNSAKSSPRGLKIGTDLQIIILERLYWQIFHFSFFSQIIASFLFFSPKRGYNFAKNQKSVNTISPK